MDPNETLSQLREAIREYESGHYPELNAEKAADAFIALDAWLSNGGFLPNAWDMQ